MNAIKITKDEKMLIEIKLHADIKVGMSYDIFEGNDQHSATNQYPKQSSKGLALGWRKWVVFCGLDPPLAVSHIGFK